MSWWVARPHDNRLFEGRRPSDELGPLLGASAAALLLLGILALLAAEDVEPFGGSVSVLAGLLCGAGLVVVGAAGVARRHVTRPPNIAATRGEVLEARSSDRTGRADDRARQRADQTRIMRTVAAGLPPPPAPRRSTPRVGGTSSRYGDQTPHVTRRSSSRTSA